MKKALLFGASGFVGSYILQALLQSPEYDRVTIVVRKKIAITDPKLKVLIGDDNSLSQLRQDLVCDDIFIALGTTKKQTPDEAAYYRIDHDYPVHAATIARENGATSVFVVSAVGANADSRIFYIRTKGQMEKDMIALGLQHTYIFRPSMIMGQRKENRPFERIFIRLWSAVNLFLVGDRLQKYKGITAQNIAIAMVHAAQNPTEKVKILYWKEMNGLLRHG